jgi:hypothetical protein
MMKPTMSSTSTFSLVASSDEAYGSDKSVSGFDETLRRGRSRTDSVKHRFVAHVFSNRNFNRCENFFIEINSKFLEE